MRVLAIHAHSDDTILAVVMKGGLDYNVTHNHFRLDPEQTSRGLKLGEGNMWLLEGLVAYLGLLTIALILGGIGTLVGLLFAVPPYRSKFGPPGQPGKADAPHTENQC
jgi:hypothetical protein